MSLAGLAGVSRLVCRVARARLCTTRQPTVTVTRASFLSRSAPAVCRALSSQPALAPQSELGSSKEDQLHLLDKMLYNLDMSLRRNGRVMGYDLNRIVRVIEASGVCSSGQASLVLKCCGQVLVDIDSKTRTEMAVKYFEMFDKLTKLDVSHYNTLLKVN